PLLRAVFAAYLRSSVRHQGIYPRRCLRRIHRVGGGARTQRVKRSQARAKRHRHQTPAGSNGTPDRFALQQRSAQDIFAGDRPARTGTHNSQANPTEKSRGNQSDKSQENSAEIISPETTPSTALDGVQSRIPPPRTPPYPQKCRIEFFKRRHFAEAIQAGIYLRAFFDLAGLTETFFGATAFTNGGCASCNAIQIRSAISSCSAAD